MDIFKEGDQGNEFFILHIPFPWLEDDGVFGLFPCVTGFGVEQDYFREVAVEV